MAASALIFIASAQAANAGTLEDVQRRGHLNCGVSEDRAGYAEQAPSGKWSGFDVDICRAVAAATLGDADKVHFFGISTRERFTILLLGTIDLFAGSATWTVTRDTALGVNFAGVTFYDGQRFLVRKELNLKSAKDLDGAVICVGIGTTSELNLSEFFKANNMEFQYYYTEFAADEIDAFSTGECDAVTTDQSALAGYRSEDPAAYTILPDVISKEPLGPVVRQGDDQWFDIVKWTIMALIQAEESGVTSENVDDMLALDDPTVKILLGVDGDIGLHMGLAGNWGYQIVKQVGNYGEIFDRNVGSDTPLGLERGVNALWIHGGLMYSMPFR
jgi:general L-amino acid transport system substrate-binding protein